MEELKNKLIEICNNSGLPLEAIYYVVKDLYRDVYDTFEQMKNNQKQEETQNDN